MTKPSIRRDILAKRSHLSAAECLTRSLRVQERFVELPEFGNAGTVALYSPFRNEVLTGEIFRRARQADKRVAFPRVRKSGLEFVEVDEAEPMLPGAFGIPEPAGARIVPLGEIDLLAVPGVVFDLRGHRLGYGQGFYDRILHGAERRSTLVGLCFELQLVDALPAEDHDVPMDLVVTEARTCRCSRGWADLSTPPFRGGNEP